MAGLTFDDLPPAPRGPAFLRPADPPQPSNEVRPPISGVSPGYEGYQGEPVPAPPISRSNVTAEDLAKGKAKLGLAFDDLPAATEAQQSVARIRQMSGDMLKKYPRMGTLDYMADAATLSTARPISGLFGAGMDKLTGAYPDATFDELYKARIHSINNRIRQAEQDTGPLAPLVGAAAQLPVMMATGGSAAAPSGVVKTAVKSAVPGFIEGASQNAGSREDALVGGTTNALLSAGTSVAADQAMKTFSPAARRGAAAEATAARGRSPDEIRTEARALYDQLDNQGISYSAQQTAPLYTGLHALRNNSVYVPSANPALVDHYNDLLHRSRQGMTFNELDNSRSAIATLARGPDEPTRVAARALLNEIDQVIAAPPAINPTGADVGQVYNQARDLWRGKSMVEDAMFHADNVDRKTAINSSADPNKAMKAEFGAVEKRWDKPGNYDPLANDPQGRELLSRVVRGGPTQNALAAVGNTLSGRFAPWAAGAAGLSIPTALGVSKNVDPMLGYSLGAASGLAAGGAANQAGKQFNRWAADLGQNDVTALMRHLTNSPPPVPGATITRDDLARIQFMEQLARMAPRVGSQVIGTEKSEEPVR